MEETSKPADQNTHTVGSDSNSKDESNSERKEYESMMIALALSLRVFGDYTLPLS